MTGSGSLAMLLGGVGLFLLGMTRMTEGLKLAAGPALGRVLSSSTQTRWRGLFSGVLVTALVQSSSAVTVAAIGFVNAGLLSFSQSLWVLFGANVGTTMTGWLVALIGLKIHVEAAALPLIGIGMALTLSGTRSRRGAVGEVLTGFGVLFLGIGFMQEAFANAGGALELGALAGHGVASVLAFVLAGFGLTVLMQSSSASLAVVLTLADTGILRFDDAAAAVIGANIGTTVTAVLAAVGATPNARRAAAAHVMFNVLTGAVALLVLPLMLMLVAGVRAAFALDTGPAVGLALFHSAFNLLGVALMWPLAGRLATFLEARFAGREADATRPRYLDENVASVPTLAVSALEKEIRRLGGLAMDQLRALLRDPRATPATAGAVAALRASIDQFETRLSRESLSGPTADTLAALLRIQHYFETCAELADDLAAGLQAGDAGDASLGEPLGRLRETAQRLLAQFDPENADFGPLHTAQQTDFEALYQAVKADTLRAGAAGRVPIERMEALLHGLSAIHRIVDQAGKAARLLRALAPDAPAADGVAVEAPSAA